MKAHAVLARLLELRRRGEQRAHMCRVCALLGWRNSFHEPTATAQDVNGGKMVALGKLVRQHELAIENGLNFLGDGIEGDVAFDEHGVNARNGALLSRARAFEQARQLGK